MNQITDTALRFGVMAAIAGILYVTVLQVTDNQTNVFLTWLSFFISITFLVVAIRKFKAENKGLLSFKEGFRISFIFIVVQTAISSVYSYIYAKFIDTEFFSKLQDLQRVEMEKRGMSDEEIDKAMEMVSWMFNPEISIVTSFVSSLIIGLVIGVVISAIMKKESDVF